MKTIVINGFALGFAKNITGIQRAAHELIYRLDTLLEGEELSVKYVYNIDDLNRVIIPEELKHIQLIPVKFDGKKLWKTRTLRKVIKDENAILCCISLETVFLKKQISFIYDIRPVTTKFDTLKFRMKYRIYMLFQKINAQFIMTDSEYQKKAIERYLHIMPSKIATLYMGYEHVLDVKKNDGVFNKYPQLKKDGYYYTLGSLAPHKNIKWVIEVAKRNRNKLFAIAGGKDLRVWKDNVEVIGIDNLLFLGYVSDEENRSLMENCQAFIHPSKYEGFGIPPLEALAYGAKIFISNATCLPEIYEDCAVYFSPDDFDVDLDAMQIQAVSPPNKIFKKCSWNKSAHQLLSIFKELAESK